jgi:hypothetical protein
MKLKLSKQIFEKYSGVKCYENPSSGSRVAPRGQMDQLTDRHDEAKSRLSQFCESPPKKKASTALEPHMQGKRSTYQAQHYTEISSDLNDWQIYPRGIRVPIIR